ncbi:MAG: hypothetical protein AVO39_10120 [delta proteobacterium MLS_D]|nr:MAG: hypothetical protein AVO39_10120 [delta proteobacterium MLS_D]
MVHNRFNPSVTLTEAIWQTVNRGTLTPEQLQDEIDYSASALKRAGLDGESGARFNLMVFVHNIEKDLIVFDEDGSVNGLVKK